jgi:hypothetical protein
MYVSFGVRSVHLVAHVVCPAPEKNSVKTGKPEIPLRCRESKQVAKTNNGVPPFGHSTHLRVFVEPDLLQYDEVWAAAGTWNDVFGAAPADIVRVAGGVVTDLRASEKGITPLA